MLALLKTIAIAVQISSKLLISICWIESNHRNVVNLDDGGSPSYGICQIKLETANWIKEKYKLPGEKLSVVDIMTPEINAYYAALYLKWQTTRYPNDLNCIISSYNAGSCIKSNQETYVKKVKEKMETL